MPYAESSGARLAYEVAGEAGDGEPVLLIMGYLVPGRAWRFQVPTLSARHPVAWFDNRGCGETEAAPGRYTTSLMADDAVALMDHLGWEKAHVVGVSMGGMIAQMVALRHRERLLSLSLLASHAGGRLPRLPPRSGLGLFLKSTFGRSGTRAEAVERLLFTERFLAECDRTWLRNIIQEDFGTPVPWRYQVSQLTAVMRHRAAPALSALEGLPTLVVQPTQDKLIHPKESARLARLIPGARLVALEDAGHGLLRQSHEPLNETLMAHFAEVEGVSLAEAS